MSLPKSLKGINDKLNAKALLCEKSWVVFHEEKRVVFIFQKNGSLIVSQNGVASKGKWEYVKSNKTILIETADVMLLLHPTFVDDVLFVLQQDGTEGYFVLIDERQIGKFVQKTIAAIVDYLKEVSGEAQELREKLEQDRKEKERQRRVLARERAETEIIQATMGLERKRKRATIVSVVSAVFLPVLFGSCELYIVAFCTLVLSGIVLVVITNNLDTQIDGAEKAIFEKHLKQIKDSNEIPD